MRTSATLLHSCLVLLVLFALSAERALHAQCTEAARNVYPGFTIGKGGWRVDTHPRRVADVNGDGMADVVGFSSTNTIVALSNGTGFTPARTPPPDSIPVSR
jgi:hypothetical protein